MLCADKDYTDKSSSLLCITHPLVLARHHYSSTASSPVIIDPSADPCFRSQVVFNQQHTGKCYCTRLSSGSLLRTCPVDTVLRNSWPPNLYRRLPPGSNAPLLPLLCVTHSRTFGLFIDLSHARIE